MHWSGSMTWRVAGCMGSCALVLSLVAGCGETASQREVSLPPSRVHALAARSKPRDLVGKARRRGSRLFAHYCVICHGTQGAGDGFNSTKLKPPPRNFTRDEFWKTATDEHLRRVIAEGGPAVGKSVLMPAWGHTLSAEQIADVTAYLHTLEKSSTDPEDNNAAETSDGG